MNGLTNRIPDSHYDVILLGGGIMSMTLGTLLHEFEPTLKIVIFERLERFAKESSELDYY